MSTRRLLLVEPDPDVREALRLLGTSYGRAVHAVPQSDDGLAALEDADRFDGALVSAEADRLDALVEALRAAGVPVVLMGERPEDTGADGRVPRPVPAMEAFWRLDALGETDGETSEEG